MDSLEDIPNAYGGLEINKKVLPSSVVANSDHGTEKADMTPENSQKTSPSVPSDMTSSGSQPGRVNPKNENNNLAYLDNKNITKSCSLQEMKSRSKSEEQQEADDVKKTLAFTIDFGDGKDVNRQRHKSILERFEQRHKRGQSLSKLEENRSPSPVTPNKPPLSGKLPRKRIINVPSESSVSSEQDERKGTAVRLREKSAQQLRDFDKRHSWSPRSSIHENAVKSVPNSAQRFKSTAITTALETASKNYPSLESSSNDPKSLDSFLCSEPPLENFPTDGDEVVSEAGTYTVDGDNYTEEQKEKMNIDKIKVLPKHPMPPIQSRPIRPTCFEEGLEVIDLEQSKTPSTQKSAKKQLTTGPRGRNILEVSYCHEPAYVAKKVSYLDKLKSRVKNISDRTFQNSPEKQVLPSPSDLGCFTSVTTSGILSYKPTLEDKIQVTRKNSLIKATVDSSEYVQGLTKVNVPVKSIIDGEKVEANKSQKYKLNIFNNSSHNIIQQNTSSDSPKASTDEEESINIIADKATQALKTASTKKDWIQEWARNAREYSGKKSNIMSRSYDKSNLCNTDNMTMSSSDYYDSEDPSENQSFCVKQLGPNNRPFKNNSIGDNEYSSDPNLRYREYQSGRRKQYEYDRGQLSDFGPVTSPTRNMRNAMLYGSDDEHFLSATILRKPPMSPSKIPSPLNTIGRPRSVSRTRSSVHGSVTNLDDEADIHLQNTAAAITALANLQRRGSLRESFKNNSLRNSPRSPLSPQHYISPNIPSPVDDTYQQKFNSPHHHPLPQNFRSQSNSSNPDAELLQEYIRRRHPSYEQQEQQEFDQTGIYCHGFEDDAEECAENIVIVEKIVAHRTPSSPVAPISHKKLVSERPNAARNSPLKATAYASPIKRSSSFSVKAQTEQRQPVTPRLQQRSQNQRQNNAIQKSASSTSFKTMMRYEDDECEFYINNNDNLNPDPDYSSNSDESHEKEPMTKSRYNKAFLMRVEQSKKAIASASTTGQTKQGVVACPNTPQMSRRDGRIRLSMRDRTSMPRDSSLNRLKEDIANLSHTKKRFNDTASKDVMSRSAGSPALAPQVNAGGKVLPKYLDISKYKAPQGQGQNFLKKDESKSYLTKAEVKRSPSSASVIGTRNDMTRTSMRSVKSAGAKPGIKKLPDPVAVAQEVKKQEFEMWKRRSKYDPMKAAAKGKKQAEALKQQHQERLSKNFESSVLRSQSFHCGVGSSSQVPTSGSRKSIGSGNNQWNIRSTESSDIDDDFNTNTS